ncbi:TRAP transporter large permease subunit [Marinomonas mediterranea]|jgi:TRAP transporter, DctM subunit|uniref:TRAP transporter large permease protein n=1 Tax=Marinomonas mediterranea (strain ATCC 700492 / JCM 21426 / NBRC 103028 / MMB-1) TaxID=717774 RepID=F2JYZ0_MARM1|nr:TRAP transporter large permease [Marinomonas mediterranea]ADZ90855.1 TRAP dicarboxylate transporter, DctM subunit [Marinomonas mediterranea MMB-1]WCN12937.1 TRAP transporter large permease subunit [Marinomonas mediterranea]WCN17007.1 TRAP transporter large permease subunit [Marinomonas mediterranea MMB-1]
MPTAIVTLLFSFIALSVPIAVAIVLACAIGLYFFSNLPLIIIPQRMFSGLDSFPLMAVPLFILAGNIMGQGGVSKRLVTFAKSLVGNIQGGLAMACVITSMIFAAVSGSSVATTYAVGAILLPAMIRHGYPKPMATAIQASSANLGIIIPPSVPLIMYGISTNTSIGKLFLAAIGPGLLMGAALIAMVVIWCLVTGQGKHDSVDRQNLLTSSKDAILALLMPTLILGGIYGGIFTPTEASAIAVIYGLFLGVFVYKEITFKDIPKILKGSVISTTSVMLIIAAASLLSFLVSRSDLPQTLSAYASDTFTTKLQFLMAVNLLLLLVGMFVETSASILLLAPILTPIAIMFGIDPVHFGIVMVVNLAIGMFTPPLGVTLFAASQVADIAVEKVILSTLVPLGTLLCCLLIITIFPELTLFWVK